MEEPTGEPTKEPTAENVTAMYRAVSFYSRTGFVEQLCKHAEKTVLCALQVEIQMLSELASIKAKSAEASGNASSSSVFSFATCSVYLRRDLALINSTIKASNIKADAAAKQAKCSRQSTVVPGASSASANRVKVSGFSPNYAKNLCMMYAAAVRKKKPVQKALNLIFEYGLALQEAGMAPTEPGNTDEYEKDLCSMI